MSETHLTRRTFLQAASASAAAVTLSPALTQPAKPAALPYPENGTLIPDDGWHLWVDEHAAWKNDAIFLPEDVRPGGPGDIARLPVNPPTGGWEVLTPAHPDTLPATLPGTVEQHLWGKYGQRPYTPDEYRYAADDPIPQNGAYFGVSWWYRSLDIPKEMQGKRIFLHIRGAHLRAEVYLNRKLVGYSIMEELPFEADLTTAANPGGENLLAIRITNPFGRYDWVDGGNAQWGAVKLYRSHGFGGLDRGMTISAKEGMVWIKDAWVLNTLSPTKIKAFITLELARNLDAKTTQILGCEVVEARSGKAVATAKVDIYVGWDKTENTASVEIAYPEATLWDLDHPQVYLLKISTLNGSSSAGRDTRTIPFGFRTFAPSGLGKDAIFRLNGRRIKLYSAISWGFWGINGMWPTPELAEKEVTQAKRLNLNCLNFHRNLAKEDVLRAHDRLGLLRYMEPGAGKLAIGRMPDAKNPKPESEADLFAQRYMFAKCVGMVKAFRSHPSVIEYCLQNEIGADLHNPGTLAVLAAMRAEDPSRCIVLNDGFVAPPRKAAQAWYEPWNDKLHRSDEEEWGGWWNQHQGAGDQYYDEFYKSPTNFTYKSFEQKALSEFGEMEGCATPDNHSLMLHQHADPAGTGIGHQPANRSYDHVDHAEILAATDSWLDRWGFRKAFPATETLWTSLGKKCYDTWQNYMENARISNDLDFAVISGWESTSIENHSGIVDNLRNFKSDPTPIAATLQPIRPVAKQRGLCNTFSEDAVFDIYLLNDTGEPVTGDLVFSVVNPRGEVTRIGQWPVPKQTADQFSYLVHEGLQFRPKRNATVPYGFEGMYRFKLELTDHPLSTQTKDIWITFTQLKKLAGDDKVGLSGVTPSLRKQLSEIEFVSGNLEDFKPGEKYAVIITSGLTHNASDKQDAGDTTGLEAQPASVVGAVQTTTQLGQIDPAVLEAVRAGTPLLAIPQADTLSEGVAKQLAAAGAFTYNGTVGDFRAPWMGNWYFVREHPVYAGMPVNQCMGIHYQARGRQSNGLLVDGPNVEILVGYSRDHDRNLGAGTFLTKLNGTKILYQRCPDFHPVLQQRFLANAISFLTYSNTSTDGKTASR